MRNETESVIRGVLAMDPTISAELIERGIAVMKDEPKEKAIEPILKRKEAAVALGLHVRTIDYYVKRGYLVPVYGAGCRAIGITRESFLRFIKRRVGAQFETTSSIVP